MKYSTKLSLISAFFFTLVSHLVFAEDAPTTINVTGTVVASPCTVDPESVTKSVPLGDIQSADMNAAGSASPWTGFTIRVMNCPAGTSSVTSTFHGTADPDDPDSGYVNTGTASNVSVEIRGTGGQPFGNDKTITLPISASSHDVTWNLQARAYSKNGGVSPGSISSATTVSFTYN